MRHIIGFALIALPLSTVLLIKSSLKKSFVICHKATDSFIDQTECVYNFGGALFYFVLVRISLCSDSSMLQLALTYIIKMPSIFQL